MEQEEIEGVLNVKSDEIARVGDDILVSGLDYQFGCGTTQYLY
jgi:hypothetical protein